MSQLCNTFINGCIAASCSNPMYAGVSYEALLFNFDQVNSLKPNNNIISAITMAEDPDTHEPYCGGYTVEQLGNRPFDGSQSEMVEGNYGNKFNHTVVFAVPDNGPAISHNIIDNLANGRFIAILKNDYVHSGSSAGDNKYQIYGGSKGLRATSIVREVWGDNESFWIVTLVEENAPVSGMFFYDTDESTTDAAFEALKCDCR